MNKQSQPLKTYRVRVGYCEVCLKAHSGEEAVAIARRQMGRELPRLYDVIQKLESARFRVEAA